MKCRTSRRAPHHSVIVDVTVYDVKSGTEIKERTKNLNLHGCRITAESPFRAGTDVALNMTCGEEKNNSDWESDTWTARNWHGHSFRSAGVALPRN